MFKSLLSRARTLPAIEQMVVWRHSLLCYSSTWEKGNLVFFSLLGLPIVVVGFLVHFAYVDRARLEAERQRHTDLNCLARNIYFEARGEPMAGQYAVAEVTVNRVASGRFPATVCEVVHQKAWDPVRKRHVGAFSWTELESTPRPRGIAWQRAMAAAEAVYDKEQPPLVHGALFYHASNIEPRWAKTKKPVAKIGRHIFYQ